MGAACAGCDAFDAPACERDFFIPLVIAETSESYLDAVVASFSVSDRLVTLALEFDPLEVDCSDAAECAAPGLIEVRIPLVGDLRGEVLEVGRAVRAGVFNDEGMHGRVEVIDPTTEEHVFDAGTLAPPERWDTPHGVAFNDGVFVEHAFAVDGASCRPLSGAPAHHAGVLVHADGGSKLVKHNDAGMHPSEGTNYVVGVPWSFTVESECDGRCKGESLVVLWRSDGEPEQ